MSRGGQFNVYRRPCRTSSWGRQAASTMQCTWNWLCSTCLKNLRNSTTDHLFHIDISCTFCIPCHRWGHAVNSHQQPINCELEPDAHSIHIIKFCFVLILQYATGTSLPYLETGCLRVRGHPLIHYLSSDACYHLTLTCYNVIFVCAGKSESPPALQHIFRTNGATNLFAGTIKHRAGGSKNT